MKNIVLILFLALMVSASSFAQKGGIRFHTKEWSEILSLAAEEDKLIFLDAYTTWCGPCKKMTKEIFTVEEVGTYYNKNFISVKMDMEKGEGLMLAEKYNVAVYPTLLFLDAAGALLHRTAGFHTVPQFLELGGIALQPENRLASMDSAYEKGNRDADFLKKYTKLRFDVADGSHHEIAEAYMDSQKDWATESNLDFIYSYVNSAHSPMFDFMVQNKGLFESRFGKNKVTKRVQDLIYGAVYDTKEKSSLTQIDELFAKVYPDQAEQLSSKFRMTYYRQAGDRTKYAESALNYFKKFKKKASPDELNETAWTFYEVIDDPKLLKQAVKMCKCSISKDSNYFNNDTLAALYYKVGNKSKALSAANKAIKMAQAGGYDFSETSNLLEKIHDMEK